MKKLLILALALLGFTALPAAAQMQNWTVLGYDAGTSVPGSCSGQPAFYFNTSAANLYFCDPIAKVFKNIPVTVNSTGTLTIAAGKTLTDNNTLTLSGTDGTTMTFPSTSATVARTDAANTFTGASTATAWNLANPVITGPAPVACTATCSPTAGQLSTCSVSTGCTATLPSATGTGNVIRFQILTTNAVSGGEKVLLTTVTDTIIGTAVGENAGTAKVFVGNAGTYHSLQMPFSGSQPSGGFAGDTVTCTDVASTVWSCDVKYQAGTTPTTPYSTATT